MIMMHRTFVTFAETAGLFRKSCSPVLLLGAQRMQSTASTEGKPERLSKNLSFRPAYDSPISQEERPLVLLYGWLVAKSRHIHKYGDFYLKKGYDVLHVKVDPFQLMWPVNAQRVVQQVVDFTQQFQRTAQPVLVHGFSVGAYLYGETLAKIISNETVAENLQGRIRGQILDSPVDFDRVPYGVSRAVTPVPILQKALETSLNGYMKLTKKQTIDHYAHSANTFKKNDFDIPTMFLYSKVDPIGIPEPIEAVIDHFQSRDIKVFSKCFAESAHVSHFHSYPVEYIQMLTLFLQEIGFLREVPKEKIQVLA